MSICKTRLSASRVFNRSSSDGFHLSVLLMCRLIVKNVCRYTLGSTINTFKNCFLVHKTKKSSHCHSRLELSCYDLLSHLQLNYHKSTEMCQLLFSHETKKKNSEKKKLETVENAGSPQIFSALMI